MKKPKVIRDEDIGNEVVLYEDGVYRWKYELSLYKNPDVFLSVWKIFLFIFLGVFLAVMTADAVREKDFFFGGFLSDLKYLGIFLAGMTAVVAIGYLIYAATMGGKYVVIFEMSEKGFVHRQVDYQAKKAKKIGRYTALAGVVSGNVGTVGAGINASRTEMYSDFSRVTKLKRVGRSDLIKVREGISVNRVYVRKEDFEKVYDFILSHCGNKKSDK